MSKHTPGPWTHERAYFVDKDYGRIPLIVPVNGENPVCKITVDYIEDVMDANARLIAAAPDLLEALDACVALIEKEVADGEHVWQSDFAKMAIAKARGEA